MTTKKITKSITAVLAVATVLAAGLAILPDSVQNAEANPCEVIGAAIEDSKIYTDCEIVGSVDIVEPHEIEEEEEEEE
jgi:adenosine/AMP kinase